MYINPLSYLKRMFFSLPRRKRILKKICDGAVPAIAFMAFALTIFYWNGRNYGLVLAYEGKEIAEVDKEETLRRASDMIREELISCDKAESAIVHPECKLAVVRDIRCASPGEVRNKIVENSQEFIEEAAGLYADDRLIGAAKDLEGVSAMLDEILDDVKSNEGFETVDFVEKLEVVKGLYFPSDIIDIGSLRSIIESGNEEKSPYVVKSGDTLSGIAQMFGMGENKILEINKIRDESEISEGKVIEVLKLDKPVHIKGVKIHAFERDLPYNSIKHENPDEWLGNSRVEKEGKNGVEKIVERVISVSGTECERQIINSEILENPVDEHISVGIRKKEKNVKNSTSSNLGFQGSCASFKGTGSSGKGMLWPVPFTKNITSGYGMRDGKLHKGIDISSAGIKGQPIVAVSDGKVESAGDLGDGYGLCVLISHENGLKTRSAHSCKLLVKKGDRVTKGQPIALVGNTGDSHGAHLHFEIICKNGITANPREYVS